MDVITPVYIPGNGARAIICRKWSVSQRQKEAINNWFVRTVVQHVGSYGGGNS